MSFASHNSRGKEGSNSDFATGGPLTWSEVSLHIGQDGVAGCQVPDADTHEVFAHLRLPEQVVKLRGGKIKRGVSRVKERDGMGERKVINETQTPGTGDHL